ncbi:MAG TPA: hypothetical protein VFU98_15590 [Microlunatus sp.]|nr:hypothetical protein [Microlunatus sp.]
MVVPLETLQGWPPAPNPTPLQVLLVLIVLPLVLALVIGGASYVATTSETKRFGPPVNPTMAFAGAPGVENAAGEVQAGIEAKPDADPGTGGTSARW